MSLFDNLVSYWPLDEVSTGAGAVARNDVHGANHLTDNATVASATGRVGNCADLEHSNAEYFSIAHNASLSLSSDQAFTWAFWWFAETFTGLPARPIVSKGGGGLAEYLVVYTTATNELALQITTTGANYSQVKTTYSGALAEWHFTVVWHDPATDKLCLQLDNGTVVEAAHAGGTFVSTGALNIGRNTNTTTQRWDGMLDEIAFWKRVLTTEERAFLYNGGLGRAYADLGMVTVIGPLGTIAFSPVSIVQVTGDAAISRPLLTVTVGVPPLEAQVSGNAQAAGALFTILASVPGGGVQASANVSGLLRAIALSVPRVDNLFKPPKPAVLHPLDFFRAGPARDLIYFWGKAGLYTRKGASAGAPLTAIWKAPYTNERLDGLGVPGIEAALPALIFWTPDLPAPKPAHGDQWSDGLTSWHVIEVRPDPRPGITVLILSLDPPHP